MLDTRHGAINTFCQRNPDLASTHGTTAIESFEAVPGAVETTVHPAYWLRPGEKSSQGLATEGRAVNNSDVAFDQTLSKRIVVGWRGNPNIIAYENFLSIPHPGSSPAQRSFEPLTGKNYPPDTYFQMSFYSTISLRRQPADKFAVYPAYTWAPAQSKFVAVDVASQCSTTAMGTLPTVLCNLAQPTILTTAAKVGGDVIYVGAYAPDQAEGQPLYSIQQYAGSGSNSLVVDFDYVNTPTVAGDHAYRTFYVVGRLREVKAGLRQLIGAFGPNSAGRACELPTQIAVGSGCPTAPQVAMR